MPNEQSSSNEETETPAPLTVDDQYVPIAVSVLPESVTLATLNEQNRKYWKNAGGEQS
jgi:hypothetical protein